MQIAILWEYRAVSTPKRIRGWKMQTVCDKILKLPTFPLRNESNIQSASLYRCWGRQTMTDCDTCGDTAALAAWWRRLVPSFLMRGSRLRGGWGKRSKQEVPGTGGEADEEAWGQWGSRLQSCPRPRRLNGKQDRVQTAFKGAEVRKAVRSIQVGKTATEPSTGWRMILYS